MSSTPRPKLLATLALAAGVALVAIRDAAPTYARYSPEGPVALIPSLSGQPEYCLTCHQGIELISPSHPTEVVGCVRCHGGQPLALDVETAHAGLLGGNNPSDFAVVEAACGGSDCHSGAPDQGRDHIQRSRTSMQATYAGAIAAVRHAFGAQPDLQARYAVFAVTDAQVTSTTGLPSLAALLPVAASEPAPVQAFGQRCLTCHLDANPLDQPGFQRLTGCAACHALSNREGTYVGDDPTLPRDESGHAARHELTTAIPFTQCNACHNRGNYSLVDMQFHERTDLSGSEPAARLADYYQPIAQFSACEVELDCVDCHPAGEVMGDGDLHSHIDEVQTVECSTCHGTTEQGPLTRRITDPDDLALRRAGLNPFAQLELGDLVVVSESGETLWNVRQRPDGAFELISKVSGLPHRVPLAAGSGCQQDPEDQASSACHECHAVERP